MSGQLVDMKTDTEDRQGSRWLRRGYVTMGVSKMRFLKGISNEGEETDLAVINRRSRASLQHYSRGPQ